MIDIAIGFGIVVLVGLGLVAVDRRRANLRRAARARADRARQLEFAEAEVVWIEGLLVEYDGGALPLSLVGFRARLQELRAEVETLRGAP